jgi:hypothetical protein
MQPFDPFDFEPLYPTVDTLGRHFGLFSDLYRTQTIRFEQYATTTHSQTMALAIAETNG